IACRVIRTARQLGVKTVAVYSDADRNAMHVHHVSTRRGGLQADEAVHIGPSAAAESYLKGDIILDVASSRGAQAIHPGYGFLSETASFCRACADAGVKFIGPPVKAIEAMGSKSASKDIMIAAGVPCTPGYHGAEQDAAFLQAQAAEMGYPVMIKAVLGGGGKGMRIAYNDEEAVLGFRLSKEEAKASFGDDRIFIEKFIEEPRHIEIQLLADQHGNVVAFPERECSIQRRNQKVVEEAPSVLLDPATRKAMGEQACALARAVGYESAGTVEFLCDKHKNFFFLEMNTRLQVEHPVTELITGVDLVELQLRAAAGEAMPFLEEKGRPIHGHAIEARVYAENPMANFLPATGKLQQLAPPTHLPGVRVDTGVRTGDEVSIFYDPMISKLIVHGSDRKQALLRMEAALAEYQIVGLPNNLSFLAKSVKHPEFAKGGVDTSFLGKYLQDVLPHPTPVPPAAAAVAAALKVVSQVHVGVDRLAGEAVSPWDVSDSSRPMGALGKAVTFLDLAVEEGAEPAPVEVALTSAQGGGARGGSGHYADVPAGQKPAYTATVGDAAFNIEVQSMEDDGSFAVVVDGTSMRGTLVTTPEAVVMYVPVGVGEAGVTQVTLGLPQPDLGVAGAGSGAPTVVTPMPGKIIKVLAKEGEAVTSGQPVVILEAMKMEHVINAPIDGTVASIRFAEGEQVGSGDVLAEFAAADA
ncbi:mccA, partial [Symbiodinium sp. KB8]